MSCDCQNIASKSSDIKIKSYLYSAIRDLKVGWPLPPLADLTSEGSDQTAFMCSLIKAFACHQYRIDGSLKTNILVY